MRYILIKTLSVILSLTMLLGVMPMSVFAETEASANISIKINDINNNVVNITASAEKEANLILASYKNGIIVNVKAERKTLIEGTENYTITGFEKGVGDVVKAFVWENIPGGFAPLCESFEKVQIFASGTVEVGKEFSENGVLIQAGDNISANVPKDVVLAENAETLTLTVATKENSESNITLNDTDSLLALDVHIDGISKDNTAPITVDLGPALATGLNSTAIKLYHVENGETVQMTYVALDEEFTAHNQFKYDPATGGLVLYLATFSEITTVTDTENAWAGEVDRSWYDESATEYFISNADQLAGLGELVCEGKSFKEKTVTLTNDINMGGEAAVNENGKLMFYPIGYGAEGYKGAFCGTFDGQGHTVSNIFQNTWMLVGTYDGTYYDEAMGLFGYVKDGVVKNLTVNNFQSDGEFTPTGCVAAYAANSTFENIAITNCNPRVYNTGNGGIVGIGGLTDDTEESKLTFKNITIDNTNKITALWGSWDVACGGLVGMFRGAGHVYMTNCHVAAQIDVYNDVCGNYQYYWYRYSGMMIGTNKNMVTDKDGYTVPETEKFHAENCTVHFGDWNDYYYCELVANSLASYTHDHQFSRLEQIKSLDEIKSGDTWRKKGNFLLISGDTKTCYHIVENEDGSFSQHLHENAGEEVVNGETVLKENNQIVYLPFNQLFTGYGWGVKHIPVYNGDDYAFEGITILDREVADSVVKFEAKLIDNSIISNNKSHAIGDLFEAISDDVLINNSSVMVSITSVETDEVAGTYTQDSSDWTKGTITFKEGYEGLVKITIQDYQFCTPTTIYVYVTDILDAIVEFNNETGNKNIGKINFANFLEKVKDFQ